jgi:ribosomal protein L37E
MMMTGTEPMGLGADRRTFECDQCGRDEEFLVKFR